MGLENLSISSEYRTGEIEPVDGLYLPCLEKAVSYDRASGYFKSTVFSLIAYEMCEFALRGGKVRIVCSPDLSEEDVNQLVQLAKDVAIDRSTQQLAKEIQQLVLDTGLREPLEMFATLLKFGILEVKIAIPAQGQGIFHEKLGVFFDGKNAVSFKGSINETYSGWSCTGNFESIDAYTTWGDQSDQSRVKSHQEYFEKLWENRIAGVLVFEAKELFDKEVVQHALPNMTDIQSLSFVKSRISVLSRKPFQHQSSAIQSWLDNGERGMFKHATGSGKTFTAILIIQRMLSSGRPVIVLVPSKLLQLQWGQELKAEFPEALVQLFGGYGKDRRSRKEVSVLTSPKKDLGPRIIVSTMSTAASDWFRSSIRQSSKLCIIADEAHQLGSSYYSSVFSINAGSRLALSATPERFGDPEGTNALFEYFGGIVQPEYSLQDALNDGRLCQYQYFPLPVHLTEAEAEQWKEDTEKIGKEISRSRRDNEGNPIISSRVQMMLINRSRIAKKAENKVVLATQVLTENYAPGQRWLVYCEDQSQLSEVKSALEERGLSPVEYHSAMTGDKAANLKWFTEVGGILVSIKCLDEGVDIPAVSHALILASSQNPRQFIQRRGRVLRLAPGKTMAYLYDAIVTPVNLEQEPEQTALLQAELSRAVEFADTAINTHSAAVLREIAIEHNIDATLLEGLGVEEDLEE